MQSKEGLWKQTPSTRVSTSPALGLVQLEHHSSAGHFSSGSPLGSAPSQHHWFEVCTPAAAVIAHCSAQLQHKETPHVPG